MQLARLAVGRGGGCDMVDQKPKIEQMWFPDSEKLRHWLGHRNNFSSKESTSSSLQFFFQNDFYQIQILQNGQAWITQ